MKILSVEPFRKKKILVTFDTGEKTALYETEAKRYGLREGEEFSQEAYEELLRDVLIPRGRKRILHLLEDMDRTEASLRRKLKEGFLPEEVIEDAVAYAKSFHYIDDERYLQNYLASRMGKKSLRQTALELEEKGIDRARIREAIEARREELTEIEGRTAYRLLEKRLKGSLEADALLKAKQYLCRKGFSYDTAERAIDEYRSGMREREGEQRMR